MKTLLILVALFCVGCTNTARNTSIDSDSSNFVWIEITGKNEKGENWYNYGKIKQSTLEKIENEGRFPEVLRIYDYHWFTDGIVLLEDNINTGQIIIKCKDFVQIAVIKEQDIEKLREKEKEADKKRAEKAKEADANENPIP